MPPALRHSLARSIEAELQLLAYLDQRLTDAIEDTRAVMTFRTLENEG
jgi:hypothetical protein